MSLSPLALNIRMNQNKHSTTTNATTTVTPQHYQSLSLHNYISLDYLRHGNPIQQSAYYSLKKSNIFSICESNKFEPILVGTIPIEINIHNSDLDIILNCPIIRQDELITLLQFHFEHFLQFSIQKTMFQNELIVMCHFLIPRIISDCDNDKDQIDINEFNNVNSTNTNNNTTTNINSNTILTNHNTDTDNIQPTPSNLSQNELNNQYFEVEIFAQSLSTIQQNGYLHMIKEAAILDYFKSIETNTSLQINEIHDVNIFTRHQQSNINSTNPKSFRQTIIELKQNGVKTEPAFAQALGLIGNPYSALLEYKIPSE